MGEETDVRHQSTALGVMGYPAHVGSWRSHLRPQGAVGGRVLEIGGVQPYCQLGLGHSQSPAECPGAQNRLVDLHPKSKDDGAQGPSPGRQSECLLGPARGACRREVLLGPCKEIWELLREKEPRFAVPGGPEAGAAGPCPDTAAAASQAWWASVLSCSVFAPDCGNVPRRREAVPRALGA